MRKKIFLTGGTGFVGREVSEELVRRGYEVRSLSHRAEAAGSVEAVQGDVLEIDSFKDSLKGCDTIIHLVGIIREVPNKGVTFEKLHVDATRNMIEVAKKNKIKRFIHMSANGAKPNGTGYQATKWQAEQLVIKSGLTYTIFRPSIIFGEHDRFTNRLVQQTRFGTMPYIGDGNYQLQPVSAKTVAQAFAESVDNMKAFNKVYHLGGPQVYTYKELLDAVAVKANRRITKIHIPVWVARAFIVLFGRLPSFSITNEQLTMLLEGNVCDSTEAMHDLNLKNTSFVIS